MAAVTFIAHDVRLIGKTPVTFARWNVDETITLNQFAMGFKNWAAGEIARNADARITLKLWAHGRPGQLQFCKEWIWLPTVQILRPLEPYVYLVEIYGCQLGRGADGNALCSYMAAMLGAYVRAAKDTQYYTYRGEGDALDFGGWEGITTTWGPAGNIVD
jgi:hypothetical protein